MRWDEEDVQQPGEALHSGCCQWNELKPLSLGLSISQQWAKDVHVQTEGSPSTGAREGQSGHLSSFLCMLPVISWFPWKLAAAEMMLWKLLPRFEANRFALLNGSTETHHYIALCVVWKTFQRSCRYPKTACTTCLCHWQPVQPQIPARGEGEEEEMEKAEKEGAETSDPISSLLVSTAHTSTRGSAVAISGGRNLLFALQSPGQHQASRCTSKVLSMWWDTQEAARRLCCSTLSGNGSLEISAGAVMLPVPLTQVLSRGLFIQCLLLYTEWSNISLVG